MNKRIVTYRATAVLLVLSTALGAQSLEPSGIVHASFSDFANLHPIVVHLPVVLLPLVLLSQVASLFVWPRPLRWVTVAALTGGVAGAVLAVTFTHPHTEGLSSAAREVLTHHDTYASWTLWLGVAALLRSAIGLWAGRQRWLQCYGHHLQRGSEDRWADGPGGHIRLFYYSR